MMGVSAFAEFSLALTALTILFCLCLFLVRPAVVIRPSFQFVVFFNLQIQWSSAMHADLIERTIRNPWEYFVIVMVVPIVGLLFALGGFREAERSVHERIMAFRSEEEYSRFLSRGILILLIPFLAVVAWYFVEVPFKSTGIYSLLFSSDSVIQKALARENSLKTVENRFLQYAFALNYSVVSPLLVIFSVLRVLSLVSVGVARSASSGDRRAMRKAIAQAVSAFWLVASNGGLFSLFVILAVLFFASIDGSRGPAAMLLLTGVFAWFLGVKKLAGKVRVLCAIPLILAVPAALNQFRVSPSFELGNFWPFYRDILDRVMGRTIQDGICHFLYTERMGFAGIAGMGNIARLFGLPPIDVFNQVGLFIQKQTLVSTVSSNVSFVIGHYTCFGLESAVLSVLSIFFVDSLLLLYRRLDTRLLIPCIAACVLGTMSLTSTFLTTILITRGILVTPVVCYFLGLEGKLPLLRRIRYRFALTTTSAQP